MLLQLRKRKKKPGRKSSPGPPWLRPSWTVQSCRCFSRQAGKGSWLAALAAVQLLVFFTGGLAAKQKKVPRSVSGFVLDKDENGIAGATVELTDLQTGKKLAIFSEEGGRYKFSDLEPLHDYELQATHKGLSSEVRRVSSFDSRNTIVINLKIEPPKS